MIASFSLRNYSDAADKFTADLIAEALPEGYQDCYDVILSDGRHKVRPALQWSIGCALFAHFLHMNAAVDRTIKP